MRNSPKSFGGGHAEVALVSARLRVPEGGRESSRLALSGRSGFGAGRFLRHACEVSVWKRRGVGALKAVPPIGTVG